MRKPGAALAPAESARAAARALGLEFTRLDLLQLALTHRSAQQGRLARNQTQSNERLEFIGDRVLGLIIAEWLAETFPHEPEGALGPRLAHLVSRDTLASIGAALGLDQFLHLGGGEESSGVHKLANVIADALEAVIGALYLDQGLEPARQFVRRHFAENLARQAEPPQDPKSSLQAWLQGRGLPLPDYALLESSGPAHAPLFTIRVSGAGREAIGHGATKRAAEREAAIKLLEQLT